MERLLKGDSGPFATSAGLHLRGIPGKKRKKGEKEEKAFHEK